MNRINCSTTPVAEIIKKVTEVLSKGGLVLFPTETVYGAGVDATNQAAVNKLLAYKSRREGKPLSIAVTDAEMAEKYVELNEQARTLYQQFLPGPLTVVSKGKGVVAEGVESEFHTLGVRIPAYPMLLEVIKAYGKPITATSANGSGKKRPYSIDDALEELSEKQKSLIDLVLDAGTLPENPPSTVIDTTLSTPVMMRAGALEVVEKKAGATKLVSNSEEETKSIAGRLLLKHWNEVGSKGVVIGLDGPLGAGKTVFTKGIAEFLQITEPITSPTYTYIEEYDFTRHQTSGKLYHLDLWKVGSSEELARLEVPSLVKPNSVVVIEWWSQVKEWLQAELPSTQVIEVALQQKDDSREIIISELSQ